jgi:hypothetical protein
MSITSEHVPFFVAKGPLRETALSHRQALALGFIGLQLGSNEPGIADRFASQVAGIVLKQPSGG